MDIAMNLPDMKEHRKPFREWLLNVCGYEIWPPTHNDPRIEGPQPRIITKRQREAMEKLWIGIEKVDGERAMRANRQ